jgi:hypothetical protein
LANSGENFVAYLVASTTHFEAQAAVLVVGSMALALFGTNEAGNRAGFDRCADEPKIRQSLPVNDAAGRVADVGAIEVEPNAPHQVRQILLTQTSIGACHAARRTVDALANASQEQLAIQGRRLGMSLEHLLKRHTLSGTGSGRS